MVNPSRAGWCVLGTSEARRKGNNCYESLMGDYARVERRGWLNNASICSTIVCCC